MKKPRFRIYITSDLKLNSPVILPDENVHYNQVHYLKNVMRANEGEILRLFNGKDGEWLGEIKNLTKKACIIELLEQSKPQENEPDLWLLFAPIKKTKIDMIAEKATELGVSCLQPVITQNTSHNKVKMDKFIAHTIEASEQCERLSVPIVHPPETLKDVVESWDNNRTLYFMDESGEGNSAIDVFSKDKTKNETTSPKAAILTGPEGGFSIEEFDFLKSLPFAKAVGLGPRILKAETAVCAALSCWQACCGDWQRQPAFKAEN
ncbi:MAG: 16S rRNA (uracil(1498)-N(3))-methyltransferase [Alphaproteobacteria bacterium]|nr:16S rRNA (uracil(1498)-N(3))-methyltransferase [Alphaproteobacteria bacterium]